VDPVTDAAARRHRRRRKKARARCAPPRARKRSPTRRGAGDVRVELRNSGEDPHNLVVSPEGTHSPLASFSEIDPGTYERRSVTLTPGRYQLWCSLELHEGLGMSTTLRVQ
jgi:plastocyanin